MLGRCLHETGASLGEPVRGAFYSARTRFHVKAGHDYEVMGIALYETSLLVLVCDENRLPSWLPSGVFSINESTIPEDWWFALIDGKMASGGRAEYRLAAIWGYEQLVRDPAHADGLIHRDKSALAVFARELQLRSAGLGPQATHPTGD